MQNDTNAPDVGNKDGLAGGDVASRCRAEAAEHQTVYADDRRRKALFAEAADIITELTYALQEIANSQPCDVMQQDSTMRVSRFKAYLAGNTVCLARAALAKVEPANNEVCGQAGQNRAD